MPQLSFDPLVLYEIIPSFNIVSQALVPQLLPAFPTSPACCLASRLDIQSKEGADRANENESLRKAYQALNDKFQLQQECFDHQVSLGVVF